MEKKQKRNIEKYYEILKPNSLIGVKANIEMGKHELALFNALIYIWQTNKKITKGSLFEFLDSKNYVSFCNLSKVMNLGINNMLRIDKKVIINPEGMNKIKNSYIGSVFEKLVDSKISLENCILPSYNSEGELDFDNGVLRFQRYKFFEARILNEWGVFENKNSNVLMFQLTPFVKALADYDLLVKKDTGVSYSKLDLSVVNSIKSARAVRLYEVLLKERNSSLFSLTYAEMSKIIYVEEKKRINESLKRIFKELEHLVKIQRFKGLVSDRIYLSFTFV